MASPFKTGHILCDAGEKFKEIVEEESKGRVEVQVQPGVGSEEEINEWCKKGKVEMQATGGRPLEVFALQYFFFNAPYVMKDFKHFMRVWELSQFLFHYLTFITHSKPEEQRLQRVTYPR